MIQQEPVPSNEQVKAHDHQLFQSRNDDRTEFFILHKLV